MNMITRKNPGIELRISGFLAVHKLFFPIGTREFNFPLIGKISEVTGSANGLHKRNPPYVWLLSRRSDFTINEIIPRRLGMIHHDCQTSVVLRHIPIMNLLFELHPRQIISIKDLTVVQLDRAVLLHLDLKGREWNGNVGEGY